jgi:maltooligosyltrehalose trehalohydrolase
MGEELDTDAPFLFFCDFHGRLAVNVREGRLRDFARFVDLSDPAVAAGLPDPGSLEAYRSCVLDGARPADADQEGAFAFLRQLLAVRRARLVPLLEGARPGGAFHRLGIAAGRWEWELAGGTRWTVLANLGQDRVEGVPRPPGERVLGHPADAGFDPLEPFSVLVHQQSGESA